MFDIKEENVSAGGKFLISKEKSEEENISSR